MNTALAAYLPKLDLNLPDSLKLNVEILKNNLPKVELNAVNVLKIAAGATVGFVVIYCGQIWYSYRFFKKIGIKTPKYKFISGNMNEITNGTYTEVIRNWTKQYGKLYGYYEGHLPIMVTSDLEIIQEVFIKQFANFTGRKKVSFQERDDSPKIGLFSASRNKWRRMRNILNPTFTPAKLKQLLPLMKLSSERFIKCIEGNQNKEINIAKFLDQFTIDVIFNCAFGIDIDCLKNPDNLFFQKSQEFFDALSSGSFIFLMPLYFYEFSYVFTQTLTAISYLISRLDQNLGNPLFWMMQNVHKILETRIEKKILRNDYVQILIESQEDAEVDKSIDMQFFDSHKFKLEKKLSLTELEFNLLHFLIAGYETTSSTLCHCIFVLSKYPDEFTKLRDEIDQSFPDSNAELDYDGIQKLEYLDLFVKEVLRMYPIANNVIARRCTNPTKVKGMDIPLDLVIAVDGLSLHYDPEIWGPVDPNEFYPLRFTDENKKNSLAYMPFGIGPRICIGMRFALLEIKLTLTKLIQNFDIIKSVNTPNKLTFVEGAIRKPKDGCPIIFRKRSLVSESN